MKCVCTCSCLRCMPRTNHHEEESRAIVEALLLVGISSPLAIVSVVMRVLKGKANPQFVKTAIGDALNAAASRAEPDDFDDDGPRRKKR